MTDTNTKEALTTEEELKLPQVEFAFCQDGDLEIDITGGRFERWTGVFLDREQATQLRDYLVRMLPS